MFRIPAIALRLALGAIPLAAVTVPVFTAPALAHEFKAGDLVVEHPWVRLPPAAGPVAGGYLVIHNGGAVADRLLSAQVAVAGKVEIHEMKVDDAGKMTMRPLPDGLEVAPGGSVALQPGGYHLMLLELSRPLTLGENLDGSLTFEKAGTVTVQFTVEPMGGPAAGGDHD
ncbi:copper chaperone PCu(A)C [Zavarzinia sp. CC-PAN008]|uniref:copper chaperone PCu(A)C n=1 Tax=Zavarzinia sp. CC-PAN008 TaxID=3243332 RepID=UPI003F744076